MNIKQLDYEELDKEIRKMINSNYYYYKDISFDTLPSLFPEDFWERVRRWIAMHLNEFFFNEFHSYRSKFTSESIEMLIDIGTKIILGTDFLDFDDESIPPEIWRGMMISHIDEAVCVTEKADFNLLNLAIIFNVSIYSYERDSHYHNLIYWLDPREYVPIEEIGYDTLFLKSIPNILKKHPIPEKIFSEELKKRLMKFISEYTDFPPEWFKTISQLYLHFAYFGFVKGKIPGIKQGAYSSQQLEDQLRN